MDTEFGKFFYSGSLVEFHAAADVFASRYNEKGRYMSCEVVRPSLENCNLPPSTYNARFLFAIKDRELSLHVYAFFFVDAIQVSGDRTYLKIDSSLPRHMDGSSLVDLNLIWLDLLIHLHVVKNSAPQLLELSQKIEPPEIEEEIKAPAREMATQQVVAPNSEKPMDELLEQPEQPVPPAKKKTNPGVKAHANAIKRLVGGQEREANYYQWYNEYQAECGDFTNKRTPENELYRKSVWKPYQKKPTGKI